MGRDGNTHGYTRQKTRRREKQRMRCEERGNATDNDSEIALSVYRTASCSAQHWYNPNQVHITTAMGIRRGSGSSLEGPTLRNP